MQCLYFSFVSSGIKRKENILSSRSTKTDSSLRDKTDEINIGVDTKQNKNKTLFENFQHAIQRVHKNIEINQKVVS